MDVGSVNTLGAAGQQQSKSRSQVQEDQALEQQQKQQQLQPEEARDEKKVNPEEILDKIKEVSQDGYYSVRFEKNDDLEELVVKVVDKESEEVIRQIPPEEILELRETLRDLRGNLVDTQS